MIHSIAAKHRLVVARVSAEEDISCIEDIKEFLVKHEGNIEKLFLEFMDADRNVMIEIANAFERDGVLYRVDSNIAVYADGYPASTKDLTKDDRESTREEIAKIKRRNGNKPVFLKIFDCGREILILFASRPIPTHRALINTTISALSKSPKASLMVADLIQKAVNNDQ
jgi:hypothetical protein